MHLCFFSVWCYSIAVPFDMFVSFVSFCFCECVFSVSGAIRLFLLTFLLISGSFVCAFVFFCPPGWCHSVVVVVFSGLFVSFGVCLCICFSLFGVARLFLLTVLLVSLFFVACVFSLFGVIR